MSAKLEKQRTDLAKKILAVKDKVILKKVETLLNEKKIKWWDDLSDSQQDAINEGLRQSAKGETITHDEARKIINRWISK